MNNIVKSILTIIIVCLTLGAVGFETWLIYSNLFDPLIPVGIAVLISSTLTLFIYKLMSNIVPKNKHTLSNENLDNDENETAENNEEINL